MSCFELRRFGVHNVIRRSLIPLLCCALFLFPPRPAEAQQLTKSQLILNLSGNVPKAGSRAEKELIKRLDVHFQSGGCSFEFVPSDLFQFREAGASKRLIKALTRGTRCRVKRQRSLRSRSKSSRAANRKTKHSVDQPPLITRLATGLTLNFPGLGGESYQPNLGAWFEYANDGLSLGVSLDLFSVSGGEEGSDSRIDATLLGWVGYQLALDKARRALFEARLGLGFRAGTDIQFTGAAGPGVVILVGDDAGAFLRFGVDAYFSTLSRAASEAYGLSNSYGDDEIEVTFDFTEVTPSVRFGMYF